MLVCLHLDPNETRAWHLDLLERLGHQPGLKASVRFVPSPPQTSYADLLLRLEGALRRRGGGRLAARVPAQAFGPSVPDTEDADITIELSGEARQGARSWALAADGEPGEEAIWHAVLLGRCPLVEIRQGSKTIAAGRVGTEATGQLIESLEDALGRTITLLIAAVNGRAPSPPAVFAAPQSSRFTAAQAGRTAAAVATRRLTSRLHRLAFRTPHWRVGWRIVTGPDLIDLGRHPESGWRDLPDDGLRFYADPFPILRDGTVTLFVEEFPHASRRGLIAAVPFGTDGPLGRPEPVLEQPYHLSYPFVFERDGEVWMIPESAEAGTIELFRATRFPGGWVREATLVADVEAGDATLVEWDGLWWMFATVRDGGAASDALHLWWAPDFRGPWRPHPANPVLIDIASARPGGRMTVRNGALIRPVQDCRDGYGAALGITRVTRLDQTGYSQQLDTVLTPGPLWPGECLHTVNEAGGFEFIDGSGRASRLWQTRKADPPLPRAGGLA